MKIIVQKNHDNVNGDQSHVVIEFMVCINAVEKAGDLTSLEDDEWTMEVISIGYPFQYAIFYLYKNRFF